MTKPKNDLLKELAKLKGIQEPLEEWSKLKNYEILMEIAKYKDQDSDNEKEDDDSEYFSRRMGSAFRK